MTDTEIIASVRRHLHVAPTADNINLAVFMVRDLETTKQAGLTDLAWAYCRYGASRREAIGLIEALEKACEL